MDYKHYYKGKDIYISYFSTYPAGLWYYPNFKEKMDEGKHRPLSDKALKATYKYALKIIYNNPVTPDNVKNHIKKLYAKIDDTTSIINHYGDIEINNVEIGDNNNINTTLYYHDITKEKTKQQKRREEEEEEEEKNHELPVHNNINLSSDDEYDELNHLGSFSSTDDTPTRTTRTLVNIDSSNYDDSESEHLGKWIINDFDLSKYLLNYRKISISDNNNKTHKELSISRRLSIHHIYYFPTSQNKSCTKYLLDEAILNKVYRQLIFTDYDVFLSKDITLWATSIQDTLKTGSRFDLELEMANNLANAAIKKDINLIIAAHILINLTHTFLPQRELNHHSEDTFVHGFISPFLNHIFSNDHNLACFWANKELSSHSYSSTTTSSISPVFPKLSTSPSFSCSSSFLSRKRTFNQNYKPDFTVYAPLFGYKFDLFIVEIKPPGSSLAIYVLPKISYEMKDMLDILVGQDMERPQVCGLWINGFKCKTYIMDLCYNGIYRFIELDSFELPKSIGDLTKIRDIMMSLLKTKNIIETTKNNLRKIITLKNNSLCPSTMDVNWNVLPKKYWKRENTGRDKKVKKLKIYIYINNNN